jgi:glycosyltransferase involved in cell wall biosynthesis
LLYEREEAGAAAIDEGLGLDPVWQLPTVSQEPVWEALKRWDPDVVFCHGLADEAFLGRLARFPVAFYAHNYDGTCLSGFKRYAWPTPQPCTRTLGWGCLGHYYPHRCGGLNPLIMWKDFRYQRAKLRALRSFRCILVASEAMRAEYLRHGFPPQRVLLVPLFPTQYHPDPEPPPPRPWSGLVLFAGRLTQPKGGSYLLQALSRVAARKLLDRPLEVAFAGDGPEAGPWAALAQELGVRATFHGWLPPADVECLMRRADLLAVPSLWPEPFGLTGIEAGCFGLPSVGYAHGGITDWLAEGDSGTLAPSPPTVEGLADALVRALADSQRHQHLRVGAWQRARQFSLAKHLTALEEILRATCLESLGR